MTRRTPPPSPAVLAEAASWSVRTLTRLLDVGHIDNPGFAPLPGRRFAP